MRTSLALSPQRGSADAELLMKGVLFLLAVAIGIAALAGLGLWSYNKAPKPTLTEELAREQAARELVQEKLLLLSQLPADVRELRCFAGKVPELLHCKMTEDGMLKLNITRFEVALPANVPAVELTYTVKGANDFTLTYGQSLNPKQRISLLRAITPVPPRGHPKNIGTAHG